MLFIGQRNHKPGLLVSNYLFPLVKIFIWSHLAGFLAISSCEFFQSEDDIDAPDQDGNTNVIVKNLTLTNEQYSNGIYSIFSGTFSMTNLPAKVAIIDDEDITEDIKQNRFLTRLSDNLKIIILVTDKKTVTSLDKPTHKCLNCKTFSVINQKVQSPLRRV